MAGLDRDIARIGERLADAAASAPHWAPPAVPDLIERIDTALRERRAA